MLTAMLAVRNITGEDLDLWTVNADQDYHEEMTKEERERQREYAEMEASQPRVPIPLAGQAVIEKILIRAFARMDKLAFAGAVGIVGACYMMLGTLILVLKGGEDVGPHMALLGQYFFGYTVSLKGVFIGFLYGFFWGFMLGWTFAYVRNAYIGFYLFYLKRRADAEALKNFFNYI